MKIVPSIASRMHRPKWRIEVLALAILAMVLSPGGDPASMLLVLASLAVLYFGGIALWKLQRVLGGE